MTNQDKLRGLMKKHKLDAKAIASMLDASQDTVTSWLRPPDNKSHRNMPNVKLRMLEMLCQVSAHNKKAVRKFMRDKRGIGGNNKRP